MQNRTLVETDEFSQMLQGLGLPQRIDDALRDSLNLIARGAEQFPVVYEPLELRLLKTKPLCLRSGGPLEKVLIYFRIRNMGEVELIWVVRDEAEA